MGLQVQIPLSSYDPGRAPGDEVRLLTYLHVREDALTLFGFATEAEREMFLLLIGVSGIGPPLAQRVLSGMAIREFKRLVAAQDVKGLTQISGVGKKLAERLVFELKDRIDVLSVPGGNGVAVPAEGPEAEATAALIGLGVDPVKVRKVLSDIHKAEGDGLPVEQLIKEALKRI